MKILVYFMRGDVREVESNSISGALARCYAEYPETRSYDVLKVINKDTKEEV